jgi:general secretion pathway protein D
MKNINYIINKIILHITTTLLFAIYTCPLQAELSTKTLPQQKNDTTENILKKIDTKATEEPIGKKTRKNKKNKKKKTISVHYDDENLVDIINSLAAQKNVNILLPQGANAIKEKLTLHLEEKISLDEFWDELLPTILDVAGLSIKPKGEMVAIIKNDKDIVREPMPIYIGVAPSKIPDTDQRIRYLYYLSNIKVPAGPEGEFPSILKELLPADTLYKTSPATNSLLITAKASDIKATMQIITQLDQVSFQEKMEIIRLNNTSARIVASMLNENILKPATEINRYRLDTRKKDESSYFSKQVRVVPEERRNSLIVLGRTQAVDRIKQFVLDYIDVELESGQSILHVYQLQYLDAEKLEPVLKKIVESTKSGGAQQARGATPSGGIERVFEEVIIKADRPGTAEQLKYYGGNKIIVAARNDDWAQIKKLIEELDIPQPQVLIEVLVADLSVDDRRLLGSITRNPDKITLPSEINVQAANLSTVITDNNNNPTTIKSDLLRDGGFPVTRSEAGSTIISLNDNDGKTWSLLEILNSFGHAKILSHPHVIATNNQEALVRIGESRLLRGEGGGTYGGAAVRKFETVNAELRVTIKPRISGGESNIVNMQVTIDINEFLSTANDTRTTRNVATNANIGSGSILALGGLIRTAASDSVNETPVLSRIPLIGWLFKRRQGDYVKNNLTVFISPTIIQPRLRRGIGEYTQDYIKVATDYAQESTLFDALKDPITRWFFKTESTAEEITEAFLAKDEFKTPSYHNNEDEHLSNAKTKKNIFNEQEMGTEVAHINMPNKALNTSAQEQQEIMTTKEETASIKPTKPIDQGIVDIAKTITNISVTESNTTTGGIKNLAPVVAQSNKVTQGDEIELRTNSLVAIHDLDDPKFDKNKCLQQLKELLAKDDNPFTTKEKEAHLQS